jgi:hypothetical protein
VRASVFQKPIFFINDFVENIRYCLKLVIQASQRECGPLPAILLRRQHLYRANPLALETAYLKQTLALNRIVSDECGNLCETRVEIPFRVLEHAQISFVGCEPIGPDGHRHLE